MKLELGPDILRSYKRLPYTAWHALAEFVDNSTQSYFDHRGELDAAYTAEGSTLEVSIILDREGTGLVRISDNAMGMGRAELTRALRVGLPPEDATGRSRYGLGMKMAACWYGNQWTVITKRLGETEEVRVTVDVEEVASGNADLEESVTRGLDPSQHYTRIEIRELNRTPQGRTLGKIKQFLGNMYRLDIDNGTMRLLWQHDPLAWEMDWLFLKDSQGNEYRKDFEFDIDGKRVWGWTGVLDQGGRAKAGFAIVHRDRMVRTWPDAWHPEALYGQMQGSNDLVNQRLVGEVHLDAFEVSHTKDDIHWMEDEEDRVQDALRDACAEYREVARATRKRQRMSPVAVQAAARAMETELNSPELADFVEADAPPADVIAADNAALLAETDTTVADFSAQISHQRRPVVVVGVLDTTKSQHDPYVISEASQPDRVLVVINMNHPHLGEIEENELLNYFRHCTYDALAEWKARNQAAGLDPGTIKRHKDKFLRVALEIQMHEEA
ncbi:MAG TPA: ATP-binding protein [Acidimicrobiales bacterium]|nr:ATP-binding protein [Acidimicrobiales bacterium]